jgi:hypothetical protein
MKIRTPDGGLIFTPFRCKHLGLDGVCRVYAHRHSVCPTCLTIPEALAAHCLPVECPYARREPHYSWGPVDRDELWQNPGVVRMCGQQMGVDPKEIERVVAERCGGWKQVPGVNK